ncbi:MAG: hypothetical protein O7I93_09030 [Gemmatimonadetes bacterium]|nr:hypothetical protein [Gemmatimonadota bacterium]
MEGHLNYFWLVVMTALTGGCGQSPPPDTLPSGGGPSITRLEPSSGPAGEAYPIQLTVHGTGFAPTDNVVSFGPVATTGLPSTAGGTAITLLVPKMAESTGEVPPMVLSPGEYAVTVTTLAGTSEPMTFVLVGPGEEARR